MATSCKLWCEGWGTVVFAILVGALCGAVAFAPLFIGLRLTRRANVASNMANMGLLMIGVFVSLAVLFISAIVCVKIARDIALPFVRFPGISFAIVQDMPVDAESVIAAWHAVTGADAFGILLWNSETQEMRPLVRVAATGSVVWEHGCGSGTSAIGAWLSASAGQPVQVDVRQPGGTIRVFADLQNNALDIEGYAVPVCRGIAYLHDSAPK